MAEVANSKPREVSFAVDERIIAGQLWGDSGLPVIALHGWLDNSASFNELAPHLQGVQLLALDCAGHGYSSHREPGQPYLIWQDVGDVLAVADQMGWQQFALLGHSRGAIISTLVAGSFPQRVSHLALIDGLRPAPVPPEQAPQQLARSIVELQQAHNRRFALYPNEEKALMVRERGDMPLSRRAAQHLVSRGLKEVPGGYTWRSDPQLKIASGFKLSDAHWDAFMLAIQAPVHLILAKDGIPRLRENLQRVVNRYPFIQVTELNGSHHLHLEAEATDVATVFNSFFGSGSNSCQTQTTTGV